MDIVIMAGGKGTRLSSLTKNQIPKPMMPFGGKPLLQLEIEECKSQGFRDFVLTVGYQKEAIMSYFGDGSKFGVSIRYFVENIPLGNAGALGKMKESLSDEFFLLNGDILFSVDLRRMLAFHHEKHADITLFAHPNSHPYDSGLLVTDAKDRLIRWITKEEPRPIWYHNLTNAGIHILKKSVLEEKDGKVDLDRDILSPSLEKHKVYAYRSPEFVKDMGTPGRFESIERIPSDFRTPRKAIFLDRDGTINRYVGFLRTMDEFELLPDVGEAIRKINKSGTLAIVVTNQPVVARGEVTLEELDQIHQKMETLLGLEGAYLDNIYVCPHHPNKGFEGEIEELKIDCECRKPKPGLILQAVKDFNINLSGSWMIGDQDTDILCGKAAGTQTAKVGEKSLLQIIEEIL